MTDTNLRTPLYGWHARHGARFVPFGGWEMPVQYTGILDEHRATRTAAGLFDVSHMGEATVSGAQAALFLDYVATNRVGDLAVGRARYTLLCAPGGGVVDDIIVYRTGPQSFLLCLNAGNTPGDIAWLSAIVSGALSPYGSPTPSNRIATIAGITKASGLRGGAMKKPAIAVSSSGAA